MKDPETFWANTAEDGACVVWVAAISHGYGVVRWGTDTRRAHRVAFFLRMGRWPNGILRHLCNNKACVLHVVEGTMSENSYDAVADGVHPMARKTHCPQGHPYDEENTYWSKTAGRCCRICHRVNGLRGYHRRKRAA